jgi:hypothetical protein
MKTEIAQTAVLLAAVVLLTACAGPGTTLNREDRSALASQSQIHAVHHHAFRVFVVESTARSLFMPVPLSVLEGMALQKDYKLQDPAPRIKERLAAVLQTDFGLTNVRVVPDSPEADAAETLRSTYKNGVVLDVRTWNWGLDNYRATYQARARLIRLADSAVIWQETCKTSVADRGKPAPAMDALLAKEAELLKAKLREAADGCADHLASLLRQG